MSKHALWHDQIDSQRELGTRPRVYKSENRTLKQVEQQEGL